MGTELVGEVTLANGERVVVTSLVAAMNATSHASVARLRSVVSMTRTVTDVSPLDELG